MQYIHRIRVGCFIMLEMSFIMCYSFGYFGGDRIYFGGDKIHFEKCSGIAAFCMHITFLFVAVLRHL